MAGSINLANVAIGFDASKITRGVDLSAGEMRKLNGIIKESISPMDRYNADLAVLEKAHKAGAVSADRMKQAVDRLQEKYKQGLPDSKQGGMFGGGKITDLASAVTLATTAFRGLQSVVGPVFDEMDRIDKITDQANKLGLSFSELNTLQRSLGESSGLGADQIAMAMQKFQIGIVEAQQSGSGASFDALAALGINPDELSGMSQSQQFARIADSMQGVATHAERLKLAFDLFGKAGVDLVSSLEEGGDKLREMEEFAKRVGMNLSDVQVEGIGAANDAMDRLSMATQGWLSQIAAGSASGLEAIADDLTRLVSVGENAEERFKNLGIAIAGVYGTAKDLFELTPGSLLGKLLAGESIGNIIGEAGSMDQSFAMMEAARKAQEAAEAEAASRGTKNEEAMAKAKQEADALAQKQKLEKEIEDAARTAEQEKKRRAQEEENERKKRTEDMIRDAQRLKEETASPFEKYMEELNRLQELIDNGAIDQQTFERGDKKLREQLQKDTAPDKNGIDLAIAPTLAAGSVEAYKFMNEQKNEEMEVALRQEELQIQQVELNKQQLEAIKEIQPIGRAR
jgi:hypothetical protein